MRCATYCRLAALGALLAVLVVPAAGISEGITVPRFHSDITVNTNGTLTVREEFTLHPLHPGRYHDIFRYLPLEPRDRWDPRYADPSIKSQPEATLLEVRRDDQLLTVKLNTLSGHPELRLEVLAGDHRYQILYTVAGAIRYGGRGEASDLLYWNELGHSWRYLVEEASIAVHLPISVPGEHISSEAYSGQQGKRDSTANAGFDLVSTSEMPGTKSYVEHHVVPGASLSIVVSWPKGAIEDHRFDERKKILSLPIALFIYYVVAWFLVARRPKGGAIMPQYTPPGNMSPAEMRYVLTGTCDEKTVAAIVTHLAAHRLVSVQPDGNEYVITRLADQLPPGLPEEEAIVFCEMFGANNTVSLFRVSNLAKLDFSANSFRLRPDQGNRLASFTASAAQSLNRRFDDSYYRRNLAYSMPAALLALACAIGLGATIAQRPGFFFMSIWFSFCGSAASVLFAMKIIPAFRDLFRGRMTISRKFSLLAPLPILLGFLGFPIILLEHMADPAYAASLVAIIILNIVFVFLLQAPTALCRDRRDEVEGFRQFLAAVELDRVDRANNPHWTPTLDIDYLAYAIALDLKQAWGDHLVCAMNNAFTTAAGE
jgi:hypothetical protein